MDILTINDRPGSYPPSWYAATAEPLPPLPPAAGEIRTDVAVVGGGYSGLSTALHLTRQGLQVTLIEASRLGAGASGRNGGQVGTGQRLEQPALETLVGEGRARQLWDMALEAVALTRALTQEAGDDCQWTEGIIHADHRPRFAAHSRGLAEHLQRRYGYDRISFLDCDAIRAEIGSTAYHSGTFDRGGAHLHPLRYALSLARLAQAAGVRLHETSRMTALEPGPVATVRTDTATIRADHVVLGLNGYHNNALEPLAQRVMPINNFIAVTEPLGGAQATALIRSRAAVADSRFVINYFRLSPDHRMIFGGGESYGYRFPEDIAAKVRAPMQEIFPSLRDARIDYAWGGTLGITMSRLPYFARLAPNVLTVGGFSGHGVAMATLAGKLAAEAIAGRAGGFDLMAGLPTAPFPGGPALRTPLLAAAMIWYSLRDRL